MTYSMYDFHKSIPASPRPQILLKVAVGLVIPLVSCSKTSLKEFTRNVLTASRRAAAIFD